MEEPAEITEFHKRLKPLLHELRQFDGPCPFVVDEKSAKHVALSHYSAGRDATYIHVSRKWDGKQPPADLAVIIDYAPAVEGMAIIYDLVDEMMQGKARPFVCNLERRLLRAYMLLPFQIEEISLQSEDRGQSRKLNVAFLDARGETIQAALPFELQLQSAGGKMLRGEYHTTDRQGGWSRELPLRAAAKEVVIRSLLTGQEESILL